MQGHTRDAAETTIELTHEEQWALHRALTDYAQVALREDTELPLPTVELALVEKIEDGEFTFTPFELSRLRYQAAFHAAREDEPPRDRDAWETTVEKIDRRCPEARC